MKLGRTGLSDADNAIRYTCTVVGCSSTRVENTGPSSAAPSPIGTGRRGLDKAFVLYSPAALLSRKELARALSAHGFTITASTLATKATRGGGPKYQQWGRRRVLYAWGDAVAWAEGRLGTVREHTSADREFHTANHHGGVKNDG